MTDAGCCYTAAMASISSRKLGLASPRRTQSVLPGGAKISDVTKITIYICNPHDVPKARKILQTYFAGNPPGSTLCVLRGLANPNFLLEIEAIAAV